MKLRDGAAYLAALGDGRDVWLAGQRVEAVTDHPALAGAARTIADYYDRQHAPEHCDAMTYEGVAGRRGLAWALPRSGEDLLQRRRLIEHVTRWHGGSMGRLPEYVPLVLWGLLDSAPDLGRREPSWPRRIEAYYDACERDDLCLSHSFADPQVDRARPSGELDRLRVVERRGGDLVLTGAKTVATLAPLADEYLVVTPPRRGLTAEQALFFAVPVDAPGLRLICRRPLADGGEPLAGRFDEMDAWAIFDHVQVPAERIFLDADVEAVQRAWRTLTVWTFYHLLIRMAVKAEIFLGVCGLITETIGTRHFQNVQAELADQIRYLETLRAFLRAAESEVKITRAGLAMPDPRTLQVAHLFAVEHFPDLPRRVVELSGQSLLMAPGEADLGSAEVRDALERHFGGEALEDKARLFRLAWDLASSGFAGRQLLFETFNARSLAQNRLALLERYDLAPYEEAARGLAGMAPGRRPVAEPGRAPHLSRPAGEGPGDRRSGHSGGEKPREEEVRIG